MAIRFTEFVEKMDGHEFGDVSEMLRRLASEHGSTLRHLLKVGLATGEFDSDTEFVTEIKALSRRLKHSPDDKFPKSPQLTEPDQVSRPMADGGGGGGDSGSAGGQED